MALSSRAGVAHAAGADEAAQQAFRAGVDAARQERWTEALAAFEKAYALSPRPVVLINLAGVQVRTGRLTEAAKNYRRILNDPPSTETAAFKRAAADVLPSLEARIPRARLRPTGLSPADVVQIDGESIAAAAVGADHPLDPGEHTLIVKRGGVERARVLFALAERELRDITLPLPGLPAAPPPSLGAGAGAGAVDVAASPPIEDPGHAGSRRRWWTSPWTWILVGAAVTGAAVAAFAIYGNHDSTFSGNIPPGQVGVR